MQKQFIFPKFANTGPTDQLNTSTALCIMPSFLLHLK